MKFNIQNCVRVVTPFIASFVLILCMVVPVDANVLDPYEYGDVVIDGDLDLVKIKLPTDDMRISAFVDGKRSFNVQGPIAQFPWSMANVDNLDIYCYPFGYESFGSGTNPSDYTYVDNVFPLDGIPSGSSLDGTSQLSIGIMDATQTCDVYVSHNMILFDKSLTQIRSIELYKQSLIDWGGTNAGFHTSWSVSTDDLAGCSYFSVVSHVELNGVDVESDNSTVFIDCRTNLINLVIPYSQLYQLQQQGAQTNKLLNEIDKQMQANGEKLDQIMNGNQVDQDAANDFENNSSNQSDKIDDANDAMNNVTKPDINDVDTDVSNIVNVGDAVTVAPFLATIVTSPHIISMFTIMLTISLAAYILFGKR